MQNMHGGSVGGILSGAAEIITGYPSEWIELGYSTGDLIRHSAARIAGAETGGQVGGFAFGAAVRQLEPLAITLGVVYLVIRVIK